ncbi:MAG TPA: hypothetical protein VGB74_14430, partial [Actinoplanes sp.]
MINDTVHGAEAPALSTDNKARHCSADVSAQETLETYPLRNSDSARRWQPGFLRLVELKLRTRYSGRQETSAIRLPPGQHSFLELFLMMNELTPPVIVDEHGDIQLYANVEAAAADVEAIDVRNGEYEFFDSAGRVIEPTIDDATSTVRLTGH